MDGVDVTNHLPAGFYETIRSPKWDERRDVLSALIANLSEHPRFDPKIKYNEIVAELKSIISKDSNVVVVTLALQALATFVKGLRKDFMKYIPMVLSHILEKFKEKKASVKEAIMDCLSLVAEHCDTAVLASPICETLDKATNPSVKASVDQWIYTILCQYPRSAVPIAFVRSVTPYLVKHSKDSDPDVRERSYLVLGAVLRLVEEKVMASIAAEVFCDKTKLKKITEHSKRAEIDFEAYEQARSSKDLPLQSPTQSENEENQEESVGGLVHSDMGVSSWDLLDETKIRDKIPPDTVANLASKKWDERKEALEKLSNILESNPRLCPDEDHSELIGILCKILEKDVNINVAALAAKCIIGFANGLRYRFAVFIPKIYTAVFEKFKEKKLILREPLVELCNVLALLTPLSAYVEVVEFALRKPNPQVKTQAALFLSRLLRQHDVNTLPLDCVRQRLGPALTKLSFDADPGSREASLVAVGAIMRVTGENVVNDCCRDIMQDDHKSAKVRKNCESLIQKFGRNASDPILKLHQKIKPTVAATKMESYKVSGANGNMLGSKCKLKVMKKMPSSSVVSKSKFKVSTTPVIRISSARPSVPAALVEVKSLNTDMAKEHEQNGSNEKDVFFDAAEEVCVVLRSRSGFGDSSGRNETYIVERKEPGTSAIEGSMPLHSTSQTTEHSDTTHFTVPSACDHFRLPAPTLRGTSGSRIPIPIYRRT